MPFLIPLFLRMGVTQRVAGRLAWATAILAAIVILGLLWALWLSSHDKRVIANDRAKANVEVAEGVIKADRAAATADVAREKERQADSLKTKEAIDNAVSQNPDAAKNPAGPVSRAAVDSLSERARKNREAAR